MKKYTIFLSAGEPSGDFLGSQLMKALKARLGKHVKFVGLGGALMAEEGLSSLFPIEELSIMGFVEVIPYIQRIRRRIQETVKAIELSQPDIVVTIDSPGFNFRVGKALKKVLPSLPLVHYVAPSVWAWRKGRARKVAQFLDHLLVLFPFEPPYFIREGLPTTFVGHPVVELGLEKKRDHSFRSRHHIASKAPVLTLLLGSRQAEVARLLPIFQETILILRQQFPDLHVVVPTLSHLAAQIQRDLKFPVTILIEPAEKFAAYRESQAALAASGTVTLELGAAGIPMVVAYKINSLTYRLVRHFVKVKYVCLINLLMDQEVVSEYLQKDCAAQKLAKGLEAFFQNQQEGTKSSLMKKQMKEALKKVNPPSPHQSPSACAAEQIYHIIFSKT